MPNDYEEETLESLDDFLDDDDDIPILGSSSSAAKKSVEESEPEETAPEDLNNPYPDVTLLQISQWDKWINRVKGLGRALSDEEMEHLDQRALMDMQAKDPSTGLPSDIALLLGLNETTVKKADPSAIARPKSIHDFFDEEEGQYLDEDRQRVPVFPDTFRFALDKVDEKFNLLNSLGVEVDFGDADKAGTARYALPNDIASLLDSSGETDARRSGSSDRFFEDESEGMFDSQDDIRKPVFPEKESLQMNIGLSLKDWVLRLKSLGKEIVES